MPGPAGGARSGAGPGSRCKTGNFPQCRARVAKPGQRRQVEGLVSQEFERSNRSPRIYCFFVNRPGYREASAASGPVSWGPGSPGHGSSRVSPHAWAGCGERSGVPPAGRGRPLPHGNSRENRRRSLARLFPDIATTAPAPTRGRGRSAKRGRGGGCRRTALWMSPTGRPAGGVGVPERNFWVTFCPERGKPPPRPPSPNGNIHHGPAYRDKPGRTGSWLTPEPHLPFPGTNVSTASWHGFSPDTATHCPRSYRRPGRRGGGCRRAAL